MKTILALILLFASFNLIAQDRNIPIALDTVTAETATFAPVYSATFLGTVNYSGIVGFQFTVKNVTDSLNNVKLWGSYDGTNYILVTTHIGAKSGAENTQVIYEVNPKYLKYKMTATAASGDAAIVKNIRYFQKSQ